MGTTSQAISDTLTGINENPGYDHAAGPTVGSGLIAAAIRNNQSGNLPFIPFIVDYVRFPGIIVPIGSNTNFTSSILIAAGPHDLLNDYVLRSSIPPLNEIPHGGEYYFDNGNINGGSLINIHSPGADPMTTPPAQILSIVFDGSGTNIPQTVLDAWPYVYASGRIAPITNPTLYGGQFYITHDPITITGAYGIGSFMYS